MNVRELKDYFQRLDDSSNEEIHRKIESSTSSRLLVSSNSSRAVDMKLHPVSKFTQYIESILTIEELSYYRKQFEDLIQNHYLDNSDEIPERFIDVLKQYLAYRWKRIKDTDFVYPHDPINPSNQLCIILSKLIAKDSVVNYHKILMPEVDHPCRVLTSAPWSESHSALHLGQYFLVKDNMGGMSICEVLDVLDRYECDSRMGIIPLLLKRWTGDPDYPGSESGFVPLNPVEQELFLSHSEAVFHYYDLINQRFSMRQSTSNMGRSLEELIIGLHSGDKYHSGSEFQASNQAYLAINKFSEVLNKLDAYDRNVLMNCATRHGISFYDIWSRLTHANDPRGVNGDHASYCVNTAAMQLADLKERNREWLYGISDQLDQFRRELPSKLNDFRRINYFDIVGNYNYLSEIHEKFDTLFVFKNGSRIFNEDSLHYLVRQILSVSRESLEHPVLPLAVDLISRIFLLHKKHFYTIVKQLNHSERDHLFGNIDPKIVQDYFDSPNFDIESLQNAADLDYETSTYWLSRFIAGEIPDNYHLQLLQKINPRVVKEYCHNDSNYSVMSDRTSPTALKILMQILGREKILTLFSTPISFNSFVDTLPRDAQLTVWSMLSGDALLQWTKLTINVDELPGIFKQITQPLESIYRHCYMTLGIVRCSPFMQCLKELIDRIEKSGLKKVKQKFHFYQSRNQIVHYKEFAPYIELVNEASRWLTDFNGDSYRRFIHKSKYFYCSTPRYLLCACFALLITMITFSLAVCLTSLVMNGMLMTPANLIWNAFRGRLSAIVPLITGTAVGGACMFKFAPPTKRDNPIRGIPMRLSSHYPLLQLNAGDRDEGDDSGNRMKIF